ncbi:MAG: hypothetical protein R6V59_03260 [Dehalococcoidia bacterium]
MSARVYILLDLACANSAQVARILRGKPGVAEVDVLDGARSIMMVIEAPERLKAGKYLVDVLDSVEGMTKDLRVLPVRNSIEKSRMGLVTL